MPLARPEDIDDEPIEESETGAVESSSALTVHDPVTGEQVTIQEALESLRDQIEVDASVPRGEAQHAAEAVDDLASVVYEQRDIIEQLRSDVAALYEALGQKTEHGYMVEAGDSGWVPSSSDPYDPTGEFR